MRKERKKERHTEREKEGKRKRGRKEGLTYLYLLAEWIVNRDKKSG